MPTSPKQRPSSLVDTRVVYCGDNLDKLRELPDGCVDLIYIDPPFNSNRIYEVFWGETREKRAFDDRHASTQAYIDFMRPRCVEMARVLKKTGSFYYHCDWHASHYVKVMLDQIFGEGSFQNEIVWQRTSSHNDSKKWAHIHDTIFFYANEGFTWNPVYLANGLTYIEKFYRFADDRGRYRLHEIIRTASMGPRPNLSYEYKGYRPEWGWMMVREKVEALDKENRLEWSKTGRPYLKRYLHEQEGKPAPTVWTDIPPISAQAQERLGYPTQKPLALMERIISASSNPNDVVLDTFCGCGTTLVAAQNLGRQWIGIDISPTACRVMAKRLRDVCHLQDNEKLWQAGHGFVVRDLPWSVEQLRRIPPYEFENWAIIALGGIPNRKKGGDMGIDGRLYPISTTSKKAEGRDKELTFMAEWYPIQVKQKDKAGRPDIDAFQTAMNRENRTKGFFVAFDYTQDAVDEIEAFYRREHKVIVAFTVSEILEGYIARKMA